MSATIRLMRYGKRKNPYYRVVVLDGRKKRDGEYIEQLGIYHPLQEKTPLTITKERYEYWVTRGATLSDGMLRLTKRKKLISFV